MVTTMRNFLVALLLLTASADAQTFGGSTVETTPAVLSAVSSVFTPPCPTLGGGFATHNIVVTAAGQSIVLPGSCPNSSVGLFATFNICNGKGGTAPCNGTTSGPFSPGISFGAGFEFPGSTVFTETQASGAKDIVTCEVMSTTVWSCGTPQYAMTPVSLGIAVLAGATSGVSGSSITTQSVSLNLVSGSTLIVGAMNYDGGSGQAISSITGTGIGTCSTYTGANGSSRFYSEIWHCAVTANGSSISVTVTFAGSTNQATVSALDISGANASPDDGIGNYNDTGIGLAGGTSYSISGTGTTTQSNELIFVCTTLIIGTSTITAGSGYTAVGTPSSQGGCEYQIQSAAGTPSGSMNFSSSQSLGSISIAATKHQ